MRHKTRMTLRARLVRALGEFGDEAVLTEAKRRFAAFLKDPASLSTDLREPVTHLVGRTADRATYDTLLALGRKTTNTSERVRYYSAAASALDPTLAKEALAIALTDELPNSLVGTLILLGRRPSIASLPGTMSAPISRRLRRKQGPSLSQHLRVQSDVEFRRSDARGRACELRAGP